MQIFNIKVISFAFWLVVSAIALPILPANAQANYNPPALTSLPLAGDTTGTTNNNTVSLIQHIPISSAIPSDGQYFGYSSSAGNWSAQTFPVASSTIAGLAKVGTGLTTSSGVISVTNPLPTGTATGQLAYWNGTSWILLPIINVDATGDISTSGVVTLAQIVGVGAKPTIAGGANATTANVSITGTGFSGKLVITTNSTTTAGATICSCTYATTLTGVAHVYVEPLTAPSASCLAYVSSESTTGFTIMTANAPAVSTALSYNWFVVQ